MARRRVPLAGADRSSGQAEAMSWVTSVMSGRRGIAAAGL